MISAHGIHARRAADGSYRSGVVLSDGLLLSASEIGLMETVPDLIFLSCCHLGKIGPEAGAGSHRLAYSLSRELIDMGVRCVVAAGWEVDDSAARTFTETFFDQMTRHNAAFGEAVTVARGATFDAHPGCNTWGAYQAYGDPSFQLKLQRGPAPDDRPLRAPDELVDWLEQRRLDSRLASAGRQRRATAREADFKTVAQRVRNRLKHVPESWTGLPEVQQALGRLYGEYGREGFALARDALLQAIGQDSTRGNVPIAAIEQLANIEARQAQRLSEAGPARDLKEARRLADDAIARLRALFALSAASPQTRPAAGAGATVNPERLAILASAFKRKAIVLARAGKPWKDVAAPLADAREAYASSAGGPDATPASNPYGPLNRLQLDALLGGAGDPPAAQLDGCQAAARERFAHSFGFFDAVMSADTELTRWLYTEALADSAATQLERCYRDAIAGLTYTDRELDSVTAQLIILADLLDCRAAAPGSGDAAEQDRNRAAVLRDVAARLSRPPNARAAATPKDGATPHEISG